MNAGIASRRARAFAASVVGLSLAFAAALVTPLAAHASPAAALPIDPGAVTAIEIHKFEQPEQLGAPATGLPQDTTGLTPVPGATFTAKAVPGIDLTTNAGQAAAAALTADDAAPLIAGEPVAASGTTDAVGNATLAPLGVGLYYVQETLTPAGFVGAAPFLVALPLTDPAALDGWLTAVHVYPKNSRVSIALDVIDAAAIALGDEVGWLSRSGIPNQAVIDGYRVVQRIDSRLELIDGGAHVTVGFDVPGAPVLLLGTHYTRTVDPITQQITVDFLPAGLAVLEAVVAAHSSAEVTVGYRTRVLADGELLNEALLYPNRATIDGGPGAPEPVGDTNVTKWGPLSIRVHERGNPSNLIPGATFRLYLSAEDARAGVSPIVVEGVGEWTTDQHGMLTIPGLRFSGFANGLDREPDDSLFRYYFAMPISFPVGWTGEKEPLRATVFSTVDAQVLTVVLWRSGEDLENTGARVTGFAVIGAVLFGLGALLLLRRRRDPERAGS